MDNFQILTGDALDMLRTLPDNSVKCCVTSPPYYALRDYGVYGQIGLEETPEEYIQRLVAVFREVRRVLTDDGTLWVNIGDSYAGSGKGQNADGSVTVTEKQMIQQSNKAAYHGKPVKNINGVKPKDLIGIPWMLAFALRADGWYLRQDIIWAKKNYMPESVTDRCTKAHEYIFLLSKSPRYYFDNKAIQEDANEKYASRYNYDFNTTEKSREHYRPKGATNTAGTKEYTGKKNKTSVWSVSNSGGYKDDEGGHYATYPPKLIEPCILAGSAEGDTVLDCFNGSATTGVVALQHGRKYIGIELNPTYAEMSRNRLFYATRQTTLF